MGGLSKAENHAAQDSHTTALSRVFGYAKVEL